MDALFKQGYAQVWELDPVNDFAPQQLLSRNGRCHPLQARIRRLGFLAESQCQADRPGVR
jgi:hypothetical protein